MKIIRTGFLGFVILSVAKDLVCSSVALASFISNTSFTITQSAFMSGGGAGANISVSNHFILQSVKIGETSFGKSSNTQFSLNGGVVLARSDVSDNLMRVHVRGTIDDPGAMLYVNEVCAVNQGTSWVAPFVSVHEGENYFYINSFDTVGNVSGTILTVMVDTHPPALPTAVFQTPTQIAHQQITGTKDAASELWVRMGAEEISIPGFAGLTSWSFNSLLDEGRNHLEFFLVDEAGNRGAALPVDIILDTDTTMFEIISPTDGAQTQSATVDIAGKILDDAAVISVNGLPVNVSETGGFFMLKNFHLPQIGSNSITVRAESVTGFTQNQTIHITRDNQALLPPTLDPISSYMSTANFSVSGNCDVDGDVSVRLNEGAKTNIGCSAGRWNYSLNFFVGENLVMVEGRDALGRMIAGEGAIVFLDITPPTSPVVSDGGNTQSSTSELGVNWFSYDRETSVVDYEYVVGTASNPPANTTFVSSDGSGQVNISGNYILDQTYYVYVRAKNAAGLFSPVGVSDGIKISDNEIPMIAELLPKIGEFRYPGELIDWQLIVHDPDDDVLQFKYALNGQTIFHFSEMSKRTYQIPNGMFGRQQVLGVVRDDPQNTFQEWPSASTSFYVARRPIEL